ncbi:MAG: thiosulfohydrolase SoxB [Rhodospirillales bacterium]|nr:thiosulfohydrolase SoxB [Rhodospirillales bacterium]
MRPSRRDLLKLLGASAAAGVMPRPSRAQANADIYDIGRSGNVRLLHMTDTHGQTVPVHFREPSVNIGMGEARGRPPHLVGAAFLEHFGIAPGTAQAHAFTYLDFAEAAHRYGKMGGYAHLATLIARLRAEAGPANTLLLDGGDSWQGSWTAHRTQGLGMVQLSNLLGVDAMTSHFEMTYGEEKFRANLKAFKGTYIAQNVFLTDEAAFNGAEALDPDSGRVFEPYIIREVGGHRVAVIGQCFPYQPIAHPRRFVPDWTFGIREAEMQKVVDKLRGAERADAVVLLSHNGMDVDLKLASRVRGIDIILGGHTHDGVPQPITVANPGGRTLVANGGSNGKFLGVVDLDVGKGRVNGIRYTLAPVFSNLLPADPAMAAQVAALRQPDAAALDEKLASAGELLYRRGNVAGTMDQVLCDAMMQELNAQIALSPGFRWGPSVLPGEAITMDLVYAHTAITYPDVYVQEMTGAAIKTIMEDVCDNLFNPDPSVQQGGDMVRMGGLDYACTPGGSMGNRITELTLTDGTKLDAAKTYRVAGWASVNLPQGGRPVWDVVATYLRGQGEVRPRRPAGVKLNGVDGNPGYAA